MPDHLWPLLRLEAKTDDELKEIYRKVYLETYVRDVAGREVKIYDWRGTRVRFHAKSFDHAFSESTNYRLNAGVHDLPFSKRRARCILWIKEVLAASTGTIERRHQLRQDSRGRMSKRRTLLVVEERYVVVLQEQTNPGGELEFVTAFSAEESYIQKIRQESALLEIKKPQSYGD